MPTKIILILKTIKFWNLAIAASVVVLLGYFISYLFATPRYSDYNTFDSVSLTERGHQDELLALRENAFKTALENDSTNTEVKLYHAIADAENDQYEVSNPLL
ncbi:MAG: hypothetical protein HRT67_02485 [Flavobacteriaceae bacterium]|nr:hypothetical protein [Flavobacteriaceae bacterium]